MRFGFVTYKLIQNILIFPITLIRMMTNFDLLYLKYHHLLLLYSLKYVENEGDALDIVQNIFVAIWENGKYDQNEEFVQAYLFRAVKHRCLNYLKHQKIIEKVGFMPTFFKS